MGAIQLGDVFGDIEQGALARDERGGAYAGAVIGVATFSQVLCAKSLAKGPDPYKNIGVRPLCHIPSQRAYPVRCKTKCFWHNLLVTTEMKGKKLCQNNILVE